MRVRTVTSMGALCLGLMGCSGHGSQDTDAAGGQAGLTAVAGGAGDSGAAVADSDAHDP